MREETTPRYDRELDPMYVSLWRTAAFVWANIVSVVGISFVWFLASVPIVTTGPATVGAYCAVLSLRESGRIDRTRVRTTVRTQFVHATLIGIVPIVLLTISGLYTVAYFINGTAVSGVLAIAAAYAGIFAWLVSIPTLLGLAEGRPTTDAVVEGYVWTANHVVGAIALGIVTVTLFAVTSLLTIAVLLLFAGVAFALHVEFVTGITETEELATPSTDQ